MENAPEKALAEDASSERLGGDTSDLSSPEGLSQDLGSSGASSSDGAEDSRGGCPLDGLEGPLLNLATAQKEHSYRILSNAATGRNRMHMDSLGLIPSETVHVLFSNFAGLVVAIKGSRLALGRPLAACLTVQELKNDDWLPGVS